MADEETTDETSEETTGDQNGDTGENELPEGVRKVLEKERKAARDAEKRAKAAEAKAQEYENANKTEAERVAERASSAEKAATQSEQKYLRLKIGTSKGLPADLAERLQGSSEEEMTADADTLLAGLKASQEPSAGSFGGGARQSAPAGDMDTAIRRAAGRR